MPALAPAVSKPSAIGPVGLLLIVVFLLAVGVAGMSTGNWVKQLDQPAPSTYRVSAGEEGKFFLKLTLKSIKGLHHTNGVRGHLEVPGDATPRALAVHDATSTEWEKKIKIPQFLAKTPTVADIESNVILLLETRIPADLALIGRTVPLTFDLDMTIPRVNPMNLKSGLEVPVKDSWTVQVEIMPPGYARIYQRTGRIALIVAGIAVALGMLKVRLGRKASRVAPAPAS
jgi:hypothetical protein